ncbi:Rpn family recombination-promoting nuclease/putative transposase [Archangium lansingense]|uniref:Rpn family recombination-promoting nuclease/putative transposase n=1 Tax=Archangium lansingense TaxID=2995310 RepID=A0ABT4APL8_9BACT|nr:Rpn family recombination-promoting nuclease/putative transposase [Archangium lansinium]MCY1083104.1 Rpn family recombination-promoting nuclease/putative transposase [Archangium lansinium]
MSGPHDRFIRYVLEHAERAAALLRTLLPPGFTARVEWSTLRSQPTALVDTAIRETRSDLIFSVRLRGSSRQAFILLEHQSHVEGRMAARMRQYVSRLLDRWEQQHRHSRHPPLILPVVLYHGPRGAWTAPLRVEELLDVPLGEARREGWLKHLLRLEYVLYDLMTHSEQELKTLACPPLVRLALVLLRLASTRELNGRLTQQVDLFREVYSSPQGERELGAVIHYLRERGTKVTGKVTRQVLGCVMREQRVEALMWTEGQRLRAEGRRKGRAEGLAEGRAEDVLRILASRGVRVDDESRQRILGCTDLTTLDLWFERALRAKSLSDVLGGPITRRPHHTEPAGAARKKTPAKSKRVGSQARAASEGTDADGRTATPGRGPRRGTG